MAIKIDKRQYKRRKERSAKTGQGSNFNPYYPNQGHNNNQGNSRNQGQRQGNYRNDTSHGTQSGPIILGATQPDNRKRKTRNMSKCKYYNYNKFRHMARQYPEPRKPQDPNQGKQTLGLTQQLKPQIAQRTQTLGITQGMYDMAKTTALYNDNMPKKGWNPSKGSSIRKPQNNFLTYKEAIADKPDRRIRKEQNRINQEQHAIRIANEQGYQERMAKYKKEAKERIQNDLKLRKQQNARQRQRYKNKKDTKKQEELREPQVLGIIRQGEAITPNPGQTQSSQIIDNIPIRTKLAQNEAR
ncbi:hypothetical protein FANTH_9942 [Fusarium anthophilum]|uniref:Uncharacterized protein n=1 Tax=Fusarium anthophilum TaxID=48485 RepID=A0A8H5DXP4_9HYPO|nr:hypothetical protein FANTH_9942 [Fusarium anthophilum]